MTTRRALLTSFASFLAAPAIVRATSLMPVKVFHDLASHNPYWNPEPRWLARFDLDKWTAEHWAAHLDMWKANIMWHSSDGVLDLPYDSFADATYD